MRVSFRAPVINVKGKHYFHAVYSRSRPDAEVFGASAGRGASSSATNIDLLAPPAGVSVKCVCVPIQINVLLCEMGTDDFTRRLTGMQRTEFI